MDANARKCTQMPAGGFAATLLIGLSGETSSTGLAIHVWRVRIEHFLAGTSPTRFPLRTLPAAGGTVLNRGGEWRRLPSSRPARSLLRRQPGVTDVRVVVCVSSLTLSRGIGVSGKPRSQRGHTGTHREYPSHRSVLGSPGGPVPILIAAFAFLAFSGFNLLYPVSV